MADALSWKGTLLTLLRVEIIAFDHISQLYATNKDFKDIWEKCTNHQPCTDFHILDGFLFQGDMVSIV